LCRAHLVVQRLLVRRVATALIVDPLLLLLGRDAPFLFIPATTTATALTLGVRYAADKDQDD
jgi:hypothetical protein